MTPSVKWKQWGQPRPYADSIYSGLITADTERQAKEHLRQCRGQTAPIKSKADKRDWWEAYFDDFFPEAQGIWRFRIIEPYTD